MMAVIIKRIIGRVTAFARAETGQSAVIVALLMTVICGFAALAIDLGYGYYQKNDLQTAADAAALAAASQLPKMTNSEARSTARKYAIKNLNSPSECTIEAYVTRSLGEVEVKISQPAKNFFSGVIGVGDRTVRARAVGKYNSQWAGEVLPFLNLDANYQPGTEMTVWDKVFSGDFESIDNYEIVNEDDPDTIYFKIDYMNGVELKKGKVATIKQEIGWIYNQKREHVYILSISQEVYNSGRVMLVDGKYRPLNKLKNNDVVDPSQLVLVECKFWFYSETQKLLILHSEAVYDFMSGELPENYECPGKVAAKLVE